MTWIIGYKGLNNTVALIADTCVSIDYHAKDKDDSMLKISLISNCQKIHVVDNQIGIGFADYLETGYGIKDELENILKHRTLRYFPEFIIRKMKETYEMKYSFPEQLRAEFLLAIMVEKTNYLYKVESPDFVPNLIPDGNFACIGIGRDYFEEELKKLTNTTSFKEVVKEIPSQAFSILMKAIYDHADVPYRYRKGISRFSQTLDILEHGFKTNLDSKILRGDGYVDPAPKCFTNFTELSADLNEKFNQELVKRGISKWCP